MAGKERAGWEYEPGQAEVQDVLGMTDADAEAALQLLLELAKADAEMAEAFGPCSATCEHGKGR
jgi:hypothetical protein